MLGLKSCHCSICTPTPCFIFIISLNIAKQEPPFPGPMSVSVAQCRVLRQAGKPKTKEQSFPKPSFFTVSFLLNYILGYSLTSLSLYPSLYPYRKTIELGKLEKLLCLPPLLTTKEVFFKQLIRSVIHIHSQTLSSEIWLRKAPFVVPLPQKNTSLLFWSFKIKNIATNI